MFLSRATTLKQGYLVLPRLNARNLAKRHSSVIHLSDLEATEKFSKVNPKAVLYFTAEWCPPCKMIKPVFSELSGKYSGISFGQIDVDENNEAAAEFEIQSIPTFVFFEGDKPTVRFSGADPNKLEELIKNLEAS